ncbi:hypothetical protein [Gimesia sp.]|uniref:hypothetical protein n=1 Tax=Gimesia sp. TaxID=2024833 RepID=UPI003A91A2A1
MVDMLDDSQASPGEWFDCINVGDDYEDEDRRRKDDDLAIEGLSLVEIVGVRTVNEDRIVHEVRLPSPSLQHAGNPDADFISSDWSYAFTGPSSIKKGYPGRMKFPPCWCRFKGSSEVADTQKIHGRYVPDNTSGNRNTGSSDNIFNQGGLMQLAGDPRGHLKMPDPTKGEYITSGWNALGIYKRRTGEKQVDNKAEENLLAYVAPAAQTGAGAILFITTEDINQDLFSIQSSPVEFLQYVDPNSNRWNQKYLVDWRGVFGHEFQWELSDGTTDVGPFLITSPAEVIKAGIETFPWCGEGNVSVYTPSASSGGRYIIEFIKDLAGKTVPSLNKRRIIIPGVAPDNLDDLSESPLNIPPIVTSALQTINFKPQEGSAFVTFTTATRRLTWAERYYGSYGAAYQNGYYGAYYGPYGYYGGYWGGPFGFFGTPWNGDFRDYYAGPYGYNIDLWTGPYVFDEDGNPGSTYNAGGFDANGFDKNGYDPNGYDINGLDINGKTRGYYGRWGHFHLLSESPAEHANDHGVEYYAGSEQVIPAGTLGVAVNVGGSGYVAVAIEERAIFIDYAD